MARIFTEEWLLERETLGVAAPEVRAEDFPEILSMHGKGGVTPTGGAGCAFRDRCLHAMPRCETETPVLRDTGDDRRVACHLT